MPSGGSIINPNLPNTGPTNGTGIVNRNMANVKTAGQSVVLSEIALGTPSDFSAETGISNTTVGPMDGIDFITGAVVGDPDSLRKGYAREIGPGNPIYQLGIRQKAQLYNRGPFNNGSGFVQLRDGRWFNSGSDLVTGDVFSTGYYGQVNANSGDRSIFGRGQGQRFTYTRGANEITKVMNPQTQ